MRSALAMRRFCKLAGLEVMYTSRLAAEVICEPGLYMASIMLLFSLDRELLHAG
jgi:hypothetical protein